MRYLLMLFLGFIACWEANGQMPTLTLDRLTTKDGLPSNDIWCITKDKQGYLWIGTGRSICRYDGYTFFTPDDQKVGYSSGISTNSKGMLYTSIASKGLCVIDSRTLKLQTVLANNFDDKDPSNDMHDRAFVDSYNQVWICDYTSVKRYDPTLKKRHLYSLSPGNIHQDASFFEDGHHRLWVVSEIGLYRYDRQQDRLTCVLGMEARPGTNKRPIRLEKAFEDTQGILWIGGYDAGLIRFSPDSLTVSARTKGLENQNVICGMESVDENGRRLLFIGTEKGVSLYYPDQDQVYHLPEFYTKGIHVKTMYDDEDNGILWIGSREGLYKYRYRNLGIRTINIPPSAVRLPVDVSCALQMPDGRYLMGLSHSGALAWRQLAIDQFRREPYPTSAYTYQLRLIQNRPVAFTDKGVFVRDSITETFSDFPGVSRLFSATEFRDGLLDRKGRFWIASLTEGLKVMDPVTTRELKLWPDQVSRELIRNNYIRTLVEGSDGKIWVATCPNGLYYFDEQQSRFVNIRDLPINKGKLLSGLCINAVQRSDDGAILVASWGGVNKVASTGKILESFDFQHDNLADTYCSNICEDKLGNIWFSTNEGIHIANPKTRKIKYFTTIEGLHSNYPVGFFKNKSNELILGHINSINILSLSALSSEKKIPRIAISSIEVKDKLLHQDLTKEISLNPDENIISFTFSTLDFEPASKNLFSYQLDGFDSSWVDLGNKHTVSFMNLPAQSYTLRVRNSNNFGIAIDKPLVVKFTVKPYFTNTWYFRALIGFVIASLIVGLMRWRVNTLAERNRLDLQVTEWRLKALQSQMNPHFLFNSLNSVQNYLLTNRGTEGARYLSKFSKLVRRIMENSNHQYLSFEKIIDTLRMYVEIESFRFNHEFSYTFDIEDNDVLMDSLLPPMLLQPYVENAIWHGLMPKEGEKKLKVTARIDQGHIVCIIDDNGVGRAFAPRTEGHISRGQEMTRGIFESLRRKDSEAKIDLVDLVDTDNNPAGTRVIMTIPIEKT